MPKIIKDEDVYKETCKLLVESGFDGMTTKELAERSNIDESSLFRKYGSKTKLVCSAVNYIFSQVPFAGLQWTGNLEGDLYSIVERYQDTAGKYGPLLQVVIMELPRHRDLRESVVSVKQNISGIRGIIEKYQETGVLQSGNPMDLVISLIAPLAMIAMNPLGMDMEAPDLKNFISRFLTGYKK
ncbi:MAG: TetR/AcrR family transcriptional regulator [bacterium]|nr:TetR/AcrR family transcriptional regulator [bacterium]